MHLGARSALPLSTDIVSVVRHVSDNANTSRARFEMNEAANLKRPYSMRL
jgi:hypothetical protein